MMKLMAPCFAIVTLLLSVISSTAQSSDFSFIYTNVFDANALDHVVAQSNIIRTDEGNWPGFDQSYWNPVNSGIEAQLTQEFSFYRPTASVFLRDKLSMFNFGGGNYGSGSLWASKDGNNWTELMDAPAPSGVTAPYWYIDNLPASLLGSSEIWIQARMLSFGSPIMAQYGRSSYPSEAPIFDLEASLVPEPSAAAFFVLAGAAIAFTRRTKSPVSQLTAKH
jgi:hypothetical protein